MPSSETLAPSEPTAAGSERASAHTWRAFRRDPLGMISLGLLILLVIVALAAPLIAPYPASYGPDVLQPPSGDHWFGTDALGRDVFSEVIWGTQQSVLVAVAASLIAIVFGTIIAVLGAYFRRLDGFISVIVDMTLSLPVLPLMILIAALVGPSTSTIIFVVAAFSWPEVTRLVRSQALTVVGLPYVDASRLMTTSPVWIITRHVLPAVTPVVVVSVVVTASRAVLSAAGLAFLGLGDPTTWSWGRILYEAQQAGAMVSAWWLTLFPSIAILILVLSATLLSIAYNDARNPRHLAR
ncbi:peptide ABC transporter permease [Microbacterium sp. MYb54]|nr:peptide ABC transporter permease [Microbacterium sp. MYb43]PQZ82612.1 peptide ABC transporter permease [Microbacterium sp. MYb40]PRB22372.1 peptide ABC transporter permease [Microbacterium sp. MYb54]PRB31335.1 peptide ABC transporter permease [Microbacterium sp. MYb50]PRB69969.1 peptide ABC transporter permease [Microbacterium sp. MYb24]PRB79346.1 peptide ABC transporter permease [Microbacterium sp. MYb32]